MKKKKFSKDDLYEMILTNFGTITDDDVDVTLEGLVERELGLTLNSEETEGTSCSSKKCNEKIPEIEKFMQLLYWSTDGNQHPFGTALQRLINKEITKKDSQFVTFETAEFNDQDFDCHRGANGIKKGENVLHNYFRNISKLVGFGDQEMVSLYDLAGMLSDLDRYHRERRYGPQVFLFTRCQHQDFHDNPASKISKCFQDWDTFLFGTSNRA